MSEDKTDILKGDAGLQSACEDLKDHGDNVGRLPDLALRGGTFTEADRKRIWTVKVDGIEIGYRLQAFRTYLNRQVFIKTPGQQIGEISNEERQRIMSAVFNVFVIQGAAVPTIDSVAPDCILLQQQIIPMVQVERQPRLRSIAGGFDG
jgi:hypothetical protein